VSYYTEARNISTKEIFAAVELILEWYSDWLIPRLCECDIEAPEEILKKVKSYIDQLRNTRERL